MVTIVLAGAGIGAAFVMAAIPPLVTQAKLLVADFPRYVHALESHDSELGRLNARLRSRSVSWTRPAGRRPPR